MSAKPQSAERGANHPDRPRNGANVAALCTPSVTETSTRFGGTKAGDSDDSSRTEIAAEPALHTGMVVDRRFVIVRQLGIGGMGEIYEAEDLLGRERIALKTIRTVYASNPGALERFRGEVRLGASISHPNVCPMRSIFVWRRPKGDLWFFTMKLLSGETLAERLGRRGQLERREAVAFAKGVASALDALHEAQIVHRDLKPSNVFIEKTRTGENAVVTDFGLARSSVKQGLWTQGDHIAGTPSYLAPEVLAGAPATPASDVYSFGVVLHEMLFGHRPGSGSTNQISAPAPAAKSRQMRNVMAKCLDRDPDQRFASAGAVAQAIEQVFAEQPLSVIIRTRLLIGGGMAALIAAKGLWTGRERTRQCWTNWLDRLRGRGMWR